MDVISGHHSFRSHLNQNSTIMDLKVIERDWKGWKGLKEMKGIEMDCHWDWNGLQVIEREWKGLKKIEMNWKELNYLERDQKWSKGIIGD